MTAAPLSSHRFCIAPMMDWSDRHCRYFWRLLTKHAVLYTEMITTGALLHGATALFLRFDPSEHPLALQLGGSDPADLAACAKLAEQHGYDEVNLNCGCPSNRVQNGAFGACLMAQPQRVADCIKAMQDACSIPVTIKHRIGIDNLDSYDAMAHFVTTIAATGCTTFIVHARKAWLSGLSPKENREIPPLRYADVQRLKREFPQLNIVINGGLHTIATCREQLQYVDGVMLGRSAYHDPYLLSTVDRDFFDASAPVLTRKEIIERLLPYIEQQLQTDTTLHHITRHILGLYQGMPGARQFRRTLSERAYRRGTGIEVLLQALTAVEPAFSNAAALNC
ncbi:MAG TPA: tRNA dihydrouridine(20/20a) synthase DusA [Spongiibacteraceae bacterium]|jgi:tRNA-dihydrouridine synthase A